MKRPAIQFYVGDWRKEPTVTCLSIAARGLWFEMLMLMFESPVRGYLLLESGHPMSDRQIARAVGCEMREVTTLLAEMEQAGTYSRNEPGREWHRDDLPATVIVNRRMVRDEKITQVRREAGSKGGKQNRSQTAPSAGEFASVLHVQNGKQNIPPSSSSSSSSSSSKPITPSSSSEESVSTTTTRDAEAVPTVAEWLREFLGYSTGENWPLPDDDLVLQVIRPVCAAGKTLHDLHAYLAELDARKCHKARGYGWFVKVIERKFGGANVTA